MLTLRYNEHDCNLFVSGFVKRLIILLTVQGKASVGREGFVFFVDMTSVLTFLLLVVGILFITFSSLQLKFSITVGQV